MDKTEEILQFWAVRESSVRQIYGTAWDIDDKYVLKVYTSLHILEKNVQVLNVLHEAGIPTAEVIPTADGSWYAGYEGKYYMLTGKLAGNHLNDIHDKVFAIKIGEIIGQLHLAFQRCQDKLDITQNSLLEELKGWVRLELEYSEWSFIHRSEFENTERYLEEIYGELPAQLIHRDVHLGNFLFCDGQFSGYIDFDLSQINIRIFDICYFLLGLLTKGNDRLGDNEWIGIVSAVVNGYERSIKLTDIEKMALPWVMESIELLFAAYFNRMGNQELAGDAARIFHFIAEHESQIKSCILPSVPESVRQRIGDRTYDMDNVGMSGAQVICFEDMVLKTEEAGEEADRELRMMEWLEGKLPVPRVLCVEQKDGLQFLLMSRVEGKMSCDESCMEDMLSLAGALAEGLKMFWNVDIKDCPYHNGLESKLRLAAERVENGLCDTENVEDGTYGENGFAGPRELLRWLQENRPEEDLVFSHGDYCLPNVFLKDGKVSGFIDLGRSGVADRYQDIALCYRSLRSNFEGRYGGRVYTGFENCRPEILFEMLGMEPDWDKVRYYILLDELF